MKKICITGADGIIGKYLCKALIPRTKFLRGFVRNLKSNVDKHEIDLIPVGNISSNLNRLNRIRVYDLIIHCTSKSHMMKEKDEIKNYHMINTLATINLAEQAAKLGIKRMVKDK